MIQAKELRIGNWTYNNIQKYYMEVDKINLIGDDGDSEINGWEEEDFDPIPLTIEILEKCGFEIGKKNYSLNMSCELFTYAVKKRFAIYYRENHGWLYTNEQRYREDSFYMTSLHQLQNLYYALTGEELIVNL